MNDIIVPMKEQSEAEVLEAVYLKKRESLGLPSPELIIRSVDWLRDQIAALPKPAVKQTGIQSKPTTEMRKYPWTDLG